MSAPTVTSVDTLKQELLDAADFIYNRDTTRGVDTLTPLRDGSGNLVYSSIDSHGFYAQAYRDGQGNLVIAYEGTSNNTLTYALGRADDLGIAEGIGCIALQDAIDFANWVHAIDPTRQLFVTGHSLGGAEAEAAASNLSFVSGGMTFGAPGLSVFYRGSVPAANFIDYVENGDPVGHTASDDWFISAGSHYGTVISLGSASTNIVLQIPILSFVGESITLLADKIITGNLEFHDLNIYASDLNITIHTPVEVPPLDLTNLHAQLSAKLAQQVVQHNSTAPIVYPTSSHPIITGPAIASTNTSTFTLLSSWFAASETPAGSGHHIDHYSIFIVRGTGNILVGTNSYSLGNVATNISQAQFATALFSSEANPGVSELAVVAFDDLGNSSIAGDLTVTVTAPARPLQPIVSSDHTLPTIVAPSEQLVTGVGSNPDLTSTYLQVTDANSANYTPAQLTYTVVSAPSHGYLLKGGSIVSSFTQADINNRLVEYQENGTIASSDSFTYYVSDPAGNRSSSTTFNITINARPASTHPTLDTNSALSVGQGQTALITNANLHVTDSGLNSWQIIYTVTSGGTRGQILADGINVVHSFTQQQVDLGLISYQNTSNLSGPDNVTFTVADAAGSGFGPATLGINVIPQNNLHVEVSRPIHNIVSNEFTSGANNPVRDSIVSSDVLFATDPGVDPANITYTVQSISDHSGYFLIGYWTAQDLSSFTGRSFGWADLDSKNRGFSYPDLYFSFTQAEINAGSVFYQSSNGDYQAQYPVVLSARDNAGNSVNNLVLPTIVQAGGLLSAGILLSRWADPLVTLLMGSARRRL